MNNPEHIARLKQMGSINSNVAYVVPYIDKFFKKYCSDPNYLKDLHKNMRETVCFVCCAEEESGDYLSVLYEGLRFAPVSITTANVVMITVKLDFGADYRIYSANGSMEFYGDSPDGK